MIKKFNEYIIFKEDLSLSDFLYLYLEDAKVVFNYSKVNIDINGMETLTGMKFQDFINEYVETAIRTNQWAGGPLNSEWANKWGSSFGVFSANIAEIGNWYNFNSTAKEWKPEIRVRLIFEDKSICYVGFNLLTKDSSSIVPDGGDVDAQNFETIKAYDFYSRLQKHKIPVVSWAMKNWGAYDYDEYYDIIHRIIPGFDFNWTK